jgi:translocation protein SEC63
LQLKIEDAVALGPDAQWEEDEISEPDEDSLAGQMALMKGGAVKRDDDSNDESSTDGDENESDSDSD